MVDNSIKNNDLIEEFFELHKYDYPNISKEQMKEICFTPFEFLSKNMKTDSLPKVRLKYFGVFQVHLRRASFMLRNNKKKFKELLMDSKQYFKYKKMLEEYIINSLKEKSVKLKQEVPQELEDALLLKLDPENKINFYYKYKLWLK